MRYQNLNKVIARLILLQRIELANPLQKKIRKMFGRYFFTNFVSKFLISSTEINFKYYSQMKQEYEMLSDLIDFNNKEVLSIGAGMCGLELIINSKSKNSFFTIIEKDYISKKIIYGWDTKNKEGYNDLKLLQTFIEDNGMKDNFEIYNFDQESLPIKEFDYIISLYSMDYHYDFDIYLDYIKKVSTKNTKIVFDSIRPDYFKNIFHNVEVILSNEKKTHNSKRIICSNLII